MYYYGNQKGVHGQEIYISHCICNQPRGCAKSLVTATPIREPKMGKLSCLCVPSELGMLVQHIVPRSLDITTAKKMQSRVLSGSPEGSEA